MPYRAIVVTGPSAAGKSSFVSDMADKLGWQVASAGIVWKAEQARLCPDGNVTVGTFWSHIPRDFFRELYFELSELARRGGVVIESRYATVMDPRYCLRVSFDAPERTRVLRAIRRGDFRPDISMAEARAALRSRLRDEQWVGQRIFGLENYTRQPVHVSLNSGMLTREAEVGILLEGLKYE